MRYLFKNSVLRFMVLLPLSCVPFELKAADGGTDPVYSVEARLYENKDLDKDRAKDDIVLDFQLSNNGSEVIEYNEYTMSISPLVVKIVDRHGRKIPGSLPPVPREDLETFFRPINPGSNVKFSYNVNEIIYVDLRGTYWIRIDAHYRVPSEISNGKVIKYTYRMASSNWIRFCASKNRKRLC